MKFQIFAATLAGMMTLSAWADDAHAAAVKTIALNQNVHVLEGQGGNIAVIEGKNGLTVVDTQFADSYPDIKKAIGNISPNPCAMSSIPTDTTTIPTAMRLLWRIISRPSSRTTTPPS